MGLKKDDPRTIQGSSSQPTIAILFFNCPLQRVQFILPNQLLKILILYDHLGKPSMGLFDDWKVISYIMGLATEAGEPGRITVSYQLIKIGSSFHAILNLLIVQR